MKSYGVSWGKWEDNRKKEGDMMSWRLFGQIVLLIGIFVFLKTFIKCMHDTFCTKCKK